MAMIATKQLTRTYGKGAAQFTALHDVNMEIEAGEALAIVGKSGSGKSTLLNLLALLDRPTAGTVVLNGQDTTIVVALYGEPVEQKNNGLLLSGSASAASFNAAATTSLSPIEQFGLALTSLTPAALASVILLLIVLVISLVAHAYRKKLPKSFQKTWYKHHGLIKAGLVLALLLFTVWMYAGGQL